MHFSKYILVVFSSLWTLTESYAGNVPVDSKIDSLYQHLSEVERVNQLVWLYASEEETLSHSIYRYGGVYFDHPLTEPPKFDGLAIAVQLDRQLNPLPNQMPQLPDLTTLASITKSDLLSTYFYFLKSNSKAYGIDYLVLPEFSLVGAAQRNLLEKMTAFDPSFFKEKQKLSYEETKNRKDIEEIFASKDYWVVKPGFLEKAEKGIKRYAAKNGQVSYETKVKNALYQYAFERNLSPPVRRLSNQLSVALAKASVIYLTKEAATLPLTSDTICLITDQPYGAMANMLRKYVYVITSYTDISRSSSTILIDNDSFVLPGLLSESRTVVYLGNLQKMEPLASIIQAALVYPDYNEIYEYVLPQQLFGTTGVTGRLPLERMEFVAFTNQELVGSERLGYAPPEMTGLDLTAMEGIGRIIKEAIQSGSTPGCQLAIALDGAIVMDEAYGYLTYDSLLPVERKTLYDLASVTKVAATLLAVMKLYEDGRIDLDGTLGMYLDAYANSNKKDLTIRSILSHNSGLKSYIPFWKKALNSERLETFYYETDEDELADRRSYGLKPDPVLLDSLQNWILQSPLINGNKDPFYNYSDIGFMTLHQVVEEITGKPMDQYLEDEFYWKMNLQQLTFNPRDKGFELFEIAPTEFDYYFRDELVWGEVHDRNASVFGGVSGHAGLFSNAHDLLVIMQTMLQSGHYNGVQFLTKETIDYFNASYFPKNRRGLGWDKKDPVVGNTSQFATESSFGHSGFTGTMVWADPTYNLIFVFLSNRIYPNSDNYQLIERNIRTRVQDVVYEAILAKWLN